MVENAIRSEIGVHELIEKLIHAVEEGSSKDSVKLLNLWQSSSYCSRNKTFKSFFLLINFNEIGKVYLLREELKPYFR